MANTTFIHAGGSVVLTRTPERAERSIRVIQPERKNAAGKRFGFVHTVKEVRFALSIRTTTAERDALVDFFENIVGGMSDAFTYERPDGSRNGVRFGSPSLQHYELVAGSHVVNIDLIEFNTAWGWSQGTALLWSNGSEILFQG